MSSVQHCILIVTLAVTTYGGSLGTVCSTSHVSPEPCLPFHVGEEKAPVIMEKLVRRFELSLAFLYPSLLCLWGVLGIKVAGESRYSDSGDGQEVCDEDPG